MFRCARPVIRLQQIYPHRPRPHPLQTTALNKHSTNPCTRHRHNTTRPLLHRRRQTLIRYKPDFTIDQQIQFDDEPRAITVDADNNTLIAFSESVKIFNPDHQLITQWQIPVEGEWITSIAADEENVYIAVTRSRKGVIARCTRAGKIINRIGEKNTDRNIQGIIVPSPYFDIALGKESLIWAANPGRHLLEAYTPNGDLAKSWGKTSFNIDGFCGCCNPTNFAILANRDFVTCEKGIKRVKISHPDGSLQSVVAPPQLFDNSPIKHTNMPKALDVAVNSHNHIFILDQATAIVHVMIKK